MCQISFLLSKAAKYKTCDTRFVFFFRKTSMNWALLKKWVLIKGKIRNRLYSLFLNLLHFALCFNFTIDASKTNSCPMTTKIITKSPIYNFAWNIFWNTFESKLEYCSLLNKNTVNKRSFSSFEILRFVLVIFYNFWFFLLFGCPLYGTNSVDCYSLIANCDFFLIWVCERNKFPSFGRSCDIQTSNRRFFF